MKRHIHDRTRPRSKNNRALRKWSKKKCKQERANGYWQWAKLENLRKGGKKYHCKLYYRCTKFGGFNLNRNGPEMPKLICSLNGPLCALCGKTSIIELVRYSRTINILDMFENDPRKIEDMTALYWGFLPCRPTTRPPTNPEMLNTGVTVHQFTPAMYQRFPYGIPLIITSKLLLSCLLELDIEFDFHRKSDVMPPPWWSRYYRSCDSCAHWGAW